MVFLTDVIFHVITIARCVFVFLSRTYFYFCPNDALKSCNFLQLMFIIIVARVQRSFETKQNFSNFFQLR